MLGSENLPSYSIHANTDEKTFSRVPLLPMKHGKDIPRNTLLPALRAPFNPVTLRSSINHRSSHPTDAWECLTVTTGRVEVVAIMISACPIYQTVNVARRRPNQPSTRITQLPMTVAPKFTNLPLDSSIEALMKPTAHIISSARQFLQGLYSSHLSPTLFHSQSKMLRSPESPGKLETYSFV